MRSCSGNSPIGAPSHFHSKKVQYKIFFDGQPGIIGTNTAKSNIEYFSENPEKADQLIIDFLKKQERAGDWIVITSDRELSVRIKNLGANAMRSEDFIKMMNRKRNEAEPNDISISRSDIDYWLNKFNS